jgi:cystathionine beta-lyase
MVTKKTICVHQGTVIDQNVQGSNTPIHTSTSHSYLDREVVYPRYFNTINQKALTDKLTALEHGEDALVFSSGMAAISTTLLSLLKSGDHAVFQKGLYGGTLSFIKTRLNDFSITYTIVEENSDDGFRKAMRENTRVIFVETPSNPLLEIIDLKSVAQLARSRGIVSIVDNTFASPINQNPLLLGIDVVDHSATKYLGGHSDICAGFVVSSQSIIERVAKVARGLGGSLNAITCYLLERSMKTLAIRVEQMNQNAMQIAEYLHSHSKVKSVYYPGLKSHAGYKVAKEQMSGFGGMLSFELRGIDSKKFQKELKLIRPSVSLGGVDTIICSPALTSHARISKTDRENLGISDSVLRLSVGIEDAVDLIADLAQALGNQTGN